MALAQPGPSSFPSIRAERSTMARKSYDGCVKFDRGIGWLRVGGRKLKELYAASLASSHQESIAFCSQVRRLLTIDVMRGPIMDRSGWAQTP